MARKPDLDSLAAAAGVTRRTIERTRREGAPPPKSGESVADWAKRFDEWRQARRVARRKGKAGADGRDWDLEGKRALALRRLHDLGVQKGRYLARDLVVAEWARRVFLVRTRLLALPRLLGSRCANQPPDLVEREAMLIVRQLLLEYAAESEATPAVEGGDE